MDRIVIRPAHASDLPALMDMAADFYAASPCTDIIEFDPVSMSNTFRRLATTSSACLLVGQVDGEAMAMIAGALSEHYLNSKHIIAQELFWWSDPRARGTGAAIRLLQGFEDWAREQGAGTVIMASTSTLAPQKLARLYARRGYKSVDVNYAKRLEV